MAATRARGEGDALLAALDQAAHDDVPARALSSLRRFDAGTLAPGRRLDLLTARAGLAVDAAIRARFGGAGGSSSDPAFLALLLRRKLGDVPDFATARTWIDRAIDRCLARAGTVFEAVGLRGGGIGERYARLWRDERFVYPDSDAGRDRAVAAMNASLAKLRRTTVPLLGPVPPWCLDVAARRSGADGRPGTRSLPLPGREGFYTVDLETIRRRPSWTLPSVVAHELLPGHMVQMPMEAAAAPHPLRLAYAPAFSEGWGIYAERLVADTGHYADDRLSELGYLHWRLFRLGRAAADIAIHRDGMSREAARARLAGWLGEPAYFAPFDVDLSRIVAEPMTRAAECLCALVLERAASRHPRGRLPRFHQRVLRWGRTRTELIAAA